MSRQDHLRKIARPLLVTNAKIRKYFEDRPLKNPDEWRRRNPLRPPSEDVLVRFIIPLISKKKARNWQTVCENLNRTIGSLRGQTSGRWKAIVTCQDRPDGIAFDDQVRFLPYPIPANVRSTDQPAKQRHLIRAASQLDRSDGYIYFLDADDILHPDLVEYIVSDNNGHGYTITRGYMIDFAARKAVPLGHGPNEQYLFREANGSSAALRFDMRTNRALCGPAFKRGPHSQTHRRAAEYGLDLAQVPFACALYVFNHGDNMQLHRGVSGWKEDLLAAARTTPDEWDTIVRSFRLDALFE